MSTVLHPARARRRPASKIGRSASAVRRTTVGSDATRARGVVVVLLLLRKPILRLRERTSANNVTSFPGASTKQLLRRRTRRSCRLAKPPPRRPKGIFLRQGTAGRKAAATASSRRLERGRGTAPVDGTVTTRKGGARIGATGPQKVAHKSNSLRSRRNSNGKALQKLLCRRSRSRKQMQMLLLST